jgi:hypothetical protein
LLIAQSLKKRIKNGNVKFYAGTNKNYSGMHDTIRTIEHLVGTLDRFSSAKELEIPSIV